MSGYAFSGKTVALPGGRTANLDGFTETFMEEFDGPGFYVAAYVTDDKTGDVVKDLFATKDIEGEYDDCVIELQDQEARFDKAVARLRAQYDKEQMAKERKEVRVRRSKNGHVAHTRSRPRRR